MLISALTMEADRNKRVKFNEKTFDSSRHYGVTELGLDTASNFMVCLFNFWLCEHILNPSHIDCDW